MIGPGWFSCCVGDKYKAATAQFVMPSHTKGQAMPGFLGGSDLAVPVGAQQGAGRGLDQGLHRQRVDDARSAGSATSPTRRACWATASNERAARRSWFVPTAKNWVNVENGNVLRTMLAADPHRRLTVKQAATAASDNIAFTLNQ